MRYWKVAVLLSVGAISATLPGNAQEKAEVKLDIVKYDGLKDAVLRNRGKVILIDFWGEF